jgi:hypothetical protein
MPKFTVSTKYGLMEVEADTQPSTAEVESWIGNNQAKQVAQETNTEVVNKAQPSISTTAIGTALEVGLPIVGGIAGAAVGTVLAPGAGTAAGAMGGAALMGGAANYIRQLMEVGEGARKDVSTGQVVASAAVSALPASLGAKAIQGASGYLKPILIRAGQGVATGAGAKAVEVAIDENRLPTWEEVALPAAAGAVLGGTLGAVERRYKVNGNLISNPVAAQAAQAGTGAGVGLYVYNEEREKGNENALGTAVMYGLLTYGGTHIPSLIARNKEAAARGAVNALGPEFVVGDDVVKGSAGLKNGFRASQQYSTELANDINKLVAATPDPAQTSADWLSVLDGVASPSVLPGDLREYALRFQKQREDNLPLLIAAYPKMKDVFVRNEDSYRRFAYRAFDGNAKRGVDWDVPAARDKFLSELADGFEKEAAKKKSPITRDQAEAYADNYMKRMVGDVGLLASGGDIDKTLIGGLSSPLKKKKDLSPAAREWLGMVDDPGTAAGITLQAQDRLILRAKYDRDLADFLITSGVGKRGNTQGLDEQHVLLFGQENPTIHGDLADIKVPKTWADAYATVNDPNLFGDNGMVKKFLAFSGFSKAMKTVGNIPEAMAPQAFGSIALAASSGSVNPVNIWRGFREAAYDMGWRGGNLTAKQRLDRLQELKYARSLGVLRGGADSQEIKTLMDSALTSDSWKKFYGRASDVYGFPDTAVRFSLWKHNAKKMEALGPEGVAFFGGDGYSKTEIDKVAARLTNDTFPTYDFIKRRLRQASAIGAANAFGSFEFEVLRNTKNNIVHTKRLLELSLKAKSQNTREEAAKQFAERAMALGGVAAATAAIATYGSRLLGTSEQDEKDLKKTLPPWDRNRAVTIKKNDDGTYTYVPLNYLMPHANMMGALTEAFTGGDPLPNLKSTFFGDDIGPLLTSATEMVTNTFYDTQVAITEPRDNVKLFERLVTRAFLPQFIVGTLTRVEKGIMGETNKLGTQYNLSDQAMRFLGVRAQTVDVLGSASVRIRDVAQPLGQELTGYKRILKGAYSKGDESLAGINEAAIYEERNRRYEAGQEQLGDIYRALKRQAEGSKAITDDKIIDAFRAAGVPNRLIIAAAMGHTVPMPRGIHQSHGEIVEAVMSDPKRRANARQELRNIAGPDRIMLGSLMESYGDYVQNERRGLTGIAKLFGGLTVGDGERADAIARSMSTFIRNGSPEVADALNRSLRRAGVITPQVQRQIRDRADRF